MNTSAAIAVSTTDAPEHAHGSARWELWFAIAAGITYAAGMIAEYVMGLPMIGWPLVFFLATYFFGGYFTVRTAIASRSSSNTSTISPRKPWLPGANSRY